MTSNVVSLAPAQWGKLDREFLCLFEWAERRDKYPDHIADERERVMECTRIARQMLQMFMVNGEQSPRLAQWVADRLSPHGKGFCAKLASSLWVRICEARRLNGAA